VKPGKGRKRVHRIIHRTFDENGDRTPYKLYPAQIRERDREREREIERERERPLHVHGNTFLIREH
jgi:hypothetical protein